MNQYRTVVALLLVGCLMASALPRTRRYITVNGERCVRGAGMMRMPPGEPRPKSCPSFKDSDGFCWLGDMGVDPKTCKGRLGEDGYASLPVSVEHHE